MGQRARKKRDYVAETYRSAYQAYIARRPQVSASVDTRERGIGMGLRRFVNVLVFKGYHGRRVAYMSSCISYTTLVWCTGPGKSGTRPECNSTSSREVLGLRRKVSWGKWVVLRRNSL